MQNRIMALRDDINCPSHVFGQRDGCADYFCKGPDGKEDEVNLVPDFIAANT